MGRSIPSGKVLRVKLRPYIFVAMARLATKFAAVRSFASLRMTVLGEEWGLVES